MEYEIKKRTKITSGQKLVLLLLEVYLPAEQRTVYIAGDEMACAVTADNFIQKDLDYNSVLIYENPYYETNPDALPPEHQKWYPLILVMVKETIDAFLETAGCVHVLPKWMPVEARVHLGEDTWAEIEKNTAHIVMYPVGHAGGIMEFVPKTELQGDGKDEPDCPTANQSDSPVIKYVRGDATHPVGEGVKYIVHICNDIGQWGADFELSLSKRWAAPEQAYCHEATRGTLNLTSMHYITVETDIVVVNMVAQESTRNQKSGRRVHYEALESCLKTLCKQVILTGGSIHMPRIGTGLDGGIWEKIEPIIQRALTGVDVTVYDLPEAET